MKAIKIILTLLSFSAACACGAGFGLGNHLIGYVFMITWAITLFLLFFMRNLK